MSSDDGFDFDEALEKLVSRGKDTMKKNCQDLFVAYTELKAAGFGEPQAMCILGVLMSGGNTYDH
jgi:hypothetical protein